jgi:hypothetical protein
LEKLRKRNFGNGFENQTEPLSKPMTVEERKLRSGIRRKCKTCIYYLALAQVCGVIPDKEMLKAGMRDVLQALEVASWHIHFKRAEELERERLASSTTSGNKT